MKRSSKQRVSAEVEAPTKQKQEPIALETQKPKCWESFFALSAPVIRSQFLTYLMAGTVVDSDHLPERVMLDAVLLSTAAREICGAEIVTDYEALLAYARAVWDRPDFTHRMMDNAHGRWANCIITRGTRDFDSPEERYIPLMVAWYLERDVPQWFARELGDDERIGQARREDRFAWDAGDVEVHEASVAHALKEERKAHKGRSKQIPAKALHAQLAKKRRAA